MRPPSEALLESPEDHGSQPILQKVKIDVEGEDGTDDRRDDASFLLFLPGSAVKGNTGLGWV